MRAKIPSHIEGAERRILVTELMAFKEKDDAHRTAVMDELTAEAERHGLFQRG